MWTHLETPPRARHLFPSYGCHVPTCVHRTRAAGGGGFCVQPAVCIPRAPRNSSDQPEWKGHRPGVGGWVWRLGGGFFRPSSLGVHGARGVCVKGDEGGG